MKIMVMGASGFVGVNVLPHLLSAGVDVIALYRQPPSGDIEAVLPGVRWMSLAEALRTSEAGLDCVLSFAGVGTPAAFERDAEAMAAAELRIAQTLCDLAVRHRPASIQYLSTAGAAYGEGWVEGETAGQGHGRVFTEDSECHPVSVYGRSKLAAERRLADGLLQRAPGTVLSVLRATNIYGLRYAKAGQQGLVNALVERWRQHLPITQYGDGLIYRDYLFATDLAEAHLACLRKPVAGLFNVGAGRSHSILDVVAAVEMATGTRFERQLLPARGFDVRFLAVSIEKARQLLGWSPQVSLDQGIARILAQQA